MGVLPAAVKTRDIELIHSVRRDGRLVRAWKSAGEEIAAAFHKSVADFKTRYLLTYTPKAVDQPGWHPIEVRLVGRRGDVTARRGYWR